MVYIPYFLLEKIVATKMTTLLKLLFYFRALPLLIPKTTLDSLQRDINTFIWLKKKPRFGYSLMHRPQSNGGLSLPNIWFNYLSARFTQLAQMYAPTSQVPWLYFEEQSILPFHLQVLLWSKSIPPREIYTLNTVVAHSYH